MPLNIQKGNMYDFVNATYNTVAGVCPFSCSYCYMKKWNLTSEPHLNEKELKCDLGENNFIFVGSGIDLWHDELPIEWLELTLTHCRKFQDNTYLFQTKNPDRFFTFTGAFPDKTWLCITLETDAYPVDGMSKAPSPIERFKSFLDLRDFYGDKFKYMVTIEPVIDFDLPKFFKMLDILQPDQINIGADSGNNGLPEPEPDKVIRLIELLENAGHKVHKKPNLKRLLI